jgi:hypothetical protein
MIALGICPRFAAGENSGTKEFAVGLFCQRLERNSGRNQITDGTNLAVKKRAKCQINCCGIDTRTELAMLLSAPQVKLRLLEKPS